MYDGDLCPADCAFERLRCTALQLLDVHIRQGGLCEECGCGWPCRTVVLAEHNLVLVHDVSPAPVPPAGHAGASRTREPRHPRSPGRESRMTAVFAPATSTEPARPVHLLPHRV